MHADWAIRTGTIKSHFSFKLSGKGFTHLVSITLGCNSGAVIFFFFFFSLSTIPPFLSPLFSPPPNTHTLQELEQQQLWRAMQMCLVLLRDPSWTSWQHVFGSPSSFCTKLPCCWQVWEGRTHSQRQGKSYIRGWRQQESLVVPVSQPYHMLPVLIPATYKHVQAGKIPSFVWFCERRGPALLLLQARFAQNKISWRIIAETLGWNASVFNPWHILLFSLREK